MKRLFRALERLRIRSYARYTPFLTWYPGFLCSVTDKSSFLSMHDEIFDREIYRFDTSVPAPRILDCGANIGLSTVYFKQRFPGARVTCFEPDPEAFAALSHNVAAAHLSDVELVNKGLGAKAETKRFFSEGADGGRIATDGDTASIIEIELTTLSPYLDAPVDFLKIDIEGSELEVLEECAAKLKNVRAIFIEYHSLHDAPQGLSKILAILSAAGFRYYIEDTGVHSAHPLAHIETHLGYDSQLNIFGYRP